MKAMRKVSRGSGFAGVLQYVEGVNEETGETHGRLIGGNMSAVDIKTMGKEYGAVRGLRPDIEKPVWHQALRLPEGERVTDNELNEAVELYMKKMGFPELTQYSVWLHDDPEGQHVHLVVNRVGLDGKVWLGQNENLISTRAVAEIEIELGFQITKGVSYEDVEGEDGQIKKKIVMPERSKIKKSELEMALRTGVQPPKIQLQNALDEVLKNKPTPQEFIEALENSGIRSIPNIASNGKMSGFSFEKDGISFKASALGKQYAWKTLEGAIDYEQVRDGAYLADHRAKVSGEAKPDRPIDGDSQRPGPAIAEGDRPIISARGIISEQDSSVGEADNGLEHSSAVGTGGSLSDKDAGRQEIIRRARENKDAEQQNSRGNRALERKNRRTQSVADSQLSSRAVYRPNVYRRVRVQVQLISRQLVRRLKALLKTKQQLSDRSSMTAGFAIKQLLRDRLNQQSVQRRTVEAEHCAGDMLVPK